ncbi:MAG: rane protein [Sphingobacteriales bacterium]|nr:rane protein [Sphingobacteriales bacterium]
MNNFFKTIIAGYGAKKLGGGCFSTILIFILIYVALGQCNKEGNRRSYDLPKQKTEASFNVSSTSVLPHE